MLPQEFLDRPIAHRGLHDRTAGRPENARAAMRAAVEGGWGIELDLQPSSDGVPMVFHDYDLDRLTEAQGPVNAGTAEALRQIRLRHAEDGIPTLSEVLDLVAGRVPVLVEIKDQDRTLGPRVGPLEQATAAILARYSGPVAVMSFNPHSVAEMARLLPDTPRGLVTCDYPERDWPEVSAARRHELAQIPDADRVGASFVSHHHVDLCAPRIAELKAGGRAVLCWTIRSAEAEAAARRVADNVTFEGYVPEQNQSSLS